MFIWVKPVIKILNADNYIVPKTLTIESALYASGCHKGMR